MVTEILSFIRLFSQLYVHLKKSGFCMIKSGSCMIGFGAFQFKFKALPFNNIDTY